MGDRTCSAGSRHVVANVSPAARCAAQGRATQPAWPTSSRRVRGTPLGRDFCSPFRSEPGRRLGRRLLRELLGLVLGLLDGADHVECHLGQVVVLALQEALEAGERVRERDELARRAREDLGDVEGLREEALDLARARDGELVVLRELVHAQNRDDVLERLVVLQELLHATRHVVVLLADHARVEDARRGVERVDGRVDAELGNRAREHRRGVEMREGGRRRGIRQIVSRHVDGLHRGDRALARGRDALLHLTHVGREGRLVADGRGDAAEQGRHLRACLRVPEDVVDEEQHVLALHVTEVLRDRERRQRDARASARRLVHLAVHERGLRLALELDHTGVHHLVVQIVALARALAHAAEDREAAVRLGDVVDELHDHDGLADAGAAEEANLAALGVRLDEVNHLDAGDKDLLLGGLVDELRRLLVDRVELVGLNRAPLIDRLANHVHDTPEALVADRDGDGLARVHDLLPAHKALGGIHRNSAHGALTEVLRNLEDEADVEILNLERVQDVRQVLIELHIDDSADHLCDTAADHRGSRERTGTERPCWEPGERAESHLLAPRPRL
mmetsp:Transcript_7769/g.19831  ORF Transcript_7769/g.19831 Transcript_7769/m.19831 type:complete len:565 (+) Transcript_7769:104-1798(+)